MREIAIDSETGLITQSNVFPPLVCVSFAERLQGDIETGVLDHVDGIAFYESVLEMAILGEAILIFHSPPFDLGVAGNERPALQPLIFEAFARGVIRCVKERQKLIDLAAGEMDFSLPDDHGKVHKHDYDLASLAWRLARITLDKSADTWRSRYIELRGTPLSKWPFEALSYAEKDAHAALVVYEVQQTLASNSDPDGVVRLCTDGVVRVTNEEEQLRAAWGLHLTSGRGFRSDAKRVAALREETDRKVEELRFGEGVTEEHGTRLWSVKELEEREGIKTGSDERSLYKIRTLKQGKNRGSTKVTKSTKALRARVERAFADGGKVLRTTPTGLAKTDADTLLDSGDPVLAVLADIGGYTYTKSNYLPFLEAATEGPVCTNFNTLVETGRASSGKPNIMNLPKHGNVRGCFKARNGFVLCSSDYEQIELCSLGQVMINLRGSSKIADFINAGLNLHLLFASVDIGISYDEAKALYELAKTTQVHHPIVDARQNAKGPNFGLPGGMGAAGLVGYMQGQMSRSEWMRIWGHLTPDQQLARARRLIDVYHRTYTDMRNHFAWGAAMTESGFGTVVQHVSGRIRGRARYTEFLNSLFQGLTADGAKEAVWRVVRECREGGWYAADGSYTYDANNLSPLFGCWPVNFVHDQILTEMPEVTAHLAAPRQGQVMYDAMKRYIPDVRVSVETALMRFWEKDAIPVYDADGKLTVWKSKHEEQ
jgi:DNA polymerase I